MSPKIGRRVHLTLMLAWVVVGLPVSFVLQKSGLWLAFLMIYQIVVGHASAWSSERPS